MKKSIIFCDRCNCQIGEGEAYLYKMFSSRKSDGMEYDNFYWTSDLCPLCVSKLATLLLAIAEKNMSENVRKQFSRDFGATKEI